MKYGCIDTGAGTAQNAPILILDEATANLDAITERAVMETILRVTSGHNLLIFTHRPIFLDQMDQVYLINNQQLTPYRSNTFQN